MLVSLNVRDVVLIERAELNFASGLNVLTGETGAGKSILLDALGLAAGERGQGRSVIRPGAEQASVVAVFETVAAHPARALLAENGLDADEILLRRMVLADGRTRAFVNDSPVGVQLAREIGDLLLEVHGQADDRGLFDPVTHRRLLDTYGGHEDMVRETERCFAALRSAEETRDTWLKNRAAAAQETEYLNHAAEELRALSPVAGEEATLTSERTLFMLADRIAKDVAQAADAVSGDGGALGNLVTALRKISRLPPEGREHTSKAEAALDAAIALVREGGNELDVLLRRLNVQPDRLADVEERLSNLRAAARKYQVPVDRLPELQAEFGGKLEALDGEGTTRAAADAELARHREAYRERAAALSAARAKAAHALENAVASELKPLKLGTARFRVALTPLSEPAAHGAERVTFQIATVDGAEFGALAKIASGGELARFALAFKVALAEANPPAIIVFDEVDRGVGGAVAAAVGERLQRLARSTQVLLVTHSPQVAARASRHFRISRRGNATRVEQLDEAERVEEIARMLAGAAVTEEARAAARRLLAEASDTPPKKRVRA